MFVGTAQFIQPVHGYSNMPDVSAASRGSRAGAASRAHEGVVLSLHGQKQSGNAARLYGPDGRSAAAAKTLPLRAGNTNQNKLNQPCKTCVERRYQDGSSDPGVSFKMPASVSPGAAGEVVRAHEQEHVSRAKAEADKKDMNVNAKVVVHTDICPECKRVYVSGGSTYITMTPKPQAVETDAAETE